MTEAAKKYDALNERLMKGRVKGDLTEDQEDDILDELSGLWWELTPKESEERDLAQD